MTKNVGKIDKVIRLIAGIIVLSTVFWGPQTPWGYLGLVFIGTALINYCPLYTLFGIKTCQHEP